MATQHILLWVVLLFVCNISFTESRAPVSEQKILTPRLTCVARYDLRPSALQSLMAHFCKLPEVDCMVIQPGGQCFEPNTLYDHASVVINACYRSHKFDKAFCPNRWGYITIIDPARYPCVF